MSLTPSAAPIIIRLYADAHIELIHQWGDGDTQQLSPEESLTFLNSKTPAELAEYHFWLRPGAADILSRFAPAVQAQLAMWR